MYANLLDVFALSLFWSASSLLLIFSIWSIRIKKYWRGVFLSLIVFSQVAFFMASFFTAKYGKSVFLGEGELGRRIANYKEVLESDTVDVMKKHLVSKFAAISLFVNRGVVIDIIDKTGNNVKYAPDSLLLREFIIEGEYLKDISENAMLSFMWLVLLPVSGFFAFKIPKNVDSGENRPII